MSEMWAGILDALGAAPELPGARCIGKWQLFDATVEPGGPGSAAAAELAEHREAALRLCAQCPALRPCREWYDSLKPRHRPQGVTAGLLNGKPCRSPIAS